MTKNKLLSSTESSLPKRGGNPLGKESSAGQRVAPKSHLTQPHPVSAFFTRYRFIMPLISIAIIAGGTFLAIQLGKGYRPTAKGLAGTGLLAANSFPPGAEVYLDGKLTSATDDTLSLNPGSYTITIKKDGYLPWEKRFTIQKELVSQTNATLFRSIASLTPLTLNGATGTTPSPDGQKLAYVVATASASVKNGLYVADLSSSLLSLQRGPRQIAKTTPQFDLTKTTLLWSPNSAQILLHAENKTGQYNYLLEADRLNDIDTMPDITPRLSLILSQWEEDIVLRETKQFALLPIEMQAIATQSATNLYFSPNEDRLMYTATASAIIPENLIVKPPSPNTQPESRTLTPNHLYVYDLTEDRNYDLGEITPNSEFHKDLLLTNNYLTNNYLTNNSLSKIASTAAADFDSPIPLTAYVKLQDAKNFKHTASNFKTHYSSIYIDGFQWYPNSTHILMVSNDRVEVIEYDSTNRTTIYSGPFDQSFIYPWPDGSKLIILTNLNPATSNSPNLYTVDIR